MNSTKSKITDPERILTLSNFISLLRVFLVIPIIYYLQYTESRLVLIILIIIVVLSDVLDGYIARKSNEVTHVGMWLDPLADSVVIMSVTLFLVIANRFPMWFFIFFIARYATISIIGLYLYNHTKFVNSANIPGKIATAFIAMTIILHIFPISSFEYINDIFIWFSFAMLVLSWMMYIKRYILEFKKV